MEDIQQTVKQYILQEFLPGEDPANLTTSLQLIRSGILESLARLRLIAFLEEHYKIQIEAHEASPANFESLDDITTFVQRKMKK